MPRYSKLQLEVFSLYRQFLREGRGKPGVREYVMQEFRKNALIPRTEIMYIEYVVRRAQHQLRTLQESNIQGMGVFTKDEDENGKEKK